MRIHSVCRWRRNKESSDMQEALKAGAEIISTDSMAVRNPEIITQEPVPSDLNVSSFPHGWTQKSVKIPSG